jgi:hypothetical protein
VTSSVSLMYLGYEIELHDERHVTVRTPDGWRIVKHARMSIPGARALVRAYRAALREEERSAA